LPASLPIRGAFEQRTRGNEKVLRRVDRCERILLSMVVATSVFVPLIYLFTPWLRFADYRLPPWAPWTGIVLMAASLWLFWRSHADLGRNWSITLEVRTGHELIQNGVYRLIRHPMYAAIFLFCFAQGLLLENWLAGWSALVAFTVLYVIRTPREERMMCEFFGEQYRDYMRQTGRLWPRVRKLNG
jgi:protein-S-isoprenylcysteine O-methyltransferase Ste14